MLEFGMNKKAQEEPAAEPNPFPGLAEKLKRLLDPQEVCRDCGAESPMGSQECKKCGCLFVRCCVCRKRLWWADGMLREKRCNACPPPVREAEEYNDEGKKEFEDEVFDRRFAFHEVKSARK